MPDIKTLIENNSQWVESLKRDNPDFFSELSKGQSPHYLWIGCADSRMPATSMLGLGPGDVFVHRNIANLAKTDDPSVNAIIQYAVGVLGVSKVIVCGHYGCGGVMAAAALDSSPANVVEEWVMPIKAVRDQHGDELASLDDDARHKKLCELNVEQQVANVCQHPAVQAAWTANSAVAVHGMIYDISTGLIKDLEISRQS